MKLNYYQLTSCLYKINEYKNNNGLYNWPVPEEFDQFVKIAHKESLRVGLLSLPNFLKKNLRLIDVPDNIFLSVANEVDIDINDKMTMKYYRGAIKETERKIEDEFDILLESISNRNGYLAYEPAVTYTKRFFYSYNSRGNNSRIVKTTLSDKELRLKDLKRDGYSVNKEMNIVFDNNGVLLDSVPEKTESLEELCQNKQKIHNIEIGRLLEDGYKLKLGDINKFTMEKPVYCTNFLELYNKETGVMYLLLMMICLLC